HLPTIWEIRTAHKPLARRQLRQAGAVYQRSSLSRTRRGRGPTSAQGLRWHAATWACPLATPASSGAELRWRAPREAPSSVRPAERLRNLPSAPYRRCRPTVTSVAKVSAQRHVSAS